MYPVLVDCLSVCVWDHLIHGMSQYQTTWYVRWLIVQDQLLHGSTQCETTWCMGWLLMWDHLIHRMAQCARLPVIWVRSVWVRLTHGTDQCVRPPVVPQAWQSESHPWKAKKEPCDLHKIFFSFSLYLSLGSSSFLSHNNIYKSKISKYIHREHLTIKIVNGLRI